MSFGFYQPDSAAEWRHETIVLLPYAGQIGIPKEMQSHVFDRFIRINNVKSGTYPGIGLGLFIASEIIKRQGGRIWVESEEKKGSRFYFTLPIRDAESE